MAVPQARQADGRARHRNILEDSYGDMGKYARLIDPFRRPGALAEEAPPPNYSPAAPLDVTLAPGSAGSSRLTSPVGRR